jgi:DNA mismatch repair protein MutL
MVREAEPVPPAPPVPEPPPPAAPYRLIGELFGTYILLEQEAALVLVDKHAAHERMLYEELLRSIRTGNRQVLLTPVTVTLSREEYAAAVADPAAVENLGFAVEDFGDGVLLVREVPVELAEGDIPGLVGEIAARLLKGNKNLTPESLDKLYYSIACKSAIRAGDRNSPEELAELIRRLEKNPQITHCPHGRPVSVKMSRYEIEKLFGRIV